MDPEYANYYTREVMLILIREFQSPDEEMKKIVLKVCVCGSFKPISQPGGWGVNTPPPPPPLISAAERGGGWYFGICAYCIYLLVPSIKGVMHWYNILAILELFSFLFWLGGGGGAWYLWICIYGIYLPIYFGSFSTSFFLGDDIYEFVFIVLSTAETSLNLKTTRSPGWHEHTIWNQSNLYAYLIGSCFRN